MLKLEFYNKEHLAFKGSKEEYRIHEDLKLEDLNHDLTPGSLGVNDDMTVKELETVFEEKFGLHVQVFRKSGDQWMQTSVTDNWTLGKQEHKGEDQDRYNQIA
jgi:hypothetical protein